MIACSNVLLDRSCTTAKIAVRAPAQLCLQLLSSDHYLSHNLLLVVRATSKTMEAPLIVRHLCGSLEVLLLINF